jgi:exopolyphosphatase/guanosine-5'-triphosphate,3'-diphosphate pyrophosphatase
MLHEVGLNINHSGMHRHSAYILQNSDLPGFNQEQQMLMATLVRYHRKAINSTICRALRCSGKSSFCR